MMERRNRSADLASEALRSIVSRRHWTPGFVGVAVGAGETAASGAGVTVKPLRCGQPPDDPLPMASTPHEVKASGAAGGSVGAGRPAPAAALTCGVAVAVAVGVAVASAFGVAALPGAATDVISGVHCPTCCHVVPSPLHCAVKTLPLRCTCSRCLTDRNDRRSCRDFLARRPHRTLARALGLALARPRRASRSLGARSLCHRYLAFALAPLLRKDKLNR